VGCRKLPDILSSFDYIWIFASDLS